MDVKKLKLDIISAGEKAVEELIKVAKEKIKKADPEDDLAADKLKNAAQAKKLAIFDAFEILNRIEQERNMLEDNPVQYEQTSTATNFAERRAK